MPPANPAATVEAENIATGVTAAFCRPALDQQLWITGMSPFLSPTAAFGYGTVDPAKVPCTAVVGEARIRDGDRDFTIRVIVPTDVGDYSVYVHRPSLADPWLVEQIAPLAGQ